MTLPGTGRFQIAVRTTRPCQATSRGRPTFTETSESTARLPSPSDAREPDEVAVAFSTIRKRSLNPVCFAGVLIITMNTNRRNQTRHAIALGITLVGENNFYLGMSENLSEGGIFIATEHAVAIGTVVTLELSLPTRAVPLVVVGTVRWARAAAADNAAGVGVQFAEVSPEDEKAIKEFIGLRPAEFYE